jgi:hypothetical protein
MAKVATPKSELTADQQGNLKSYQIGLDEDGQPVSQYKYLPGVVRQYRFDAKEGKFKINMGGDNLKDAGRTLTMRPLAWRMFWDPNLFNQGPKDWAELFFIDEKNCVSAVLFHGFSVQSLSDLMGPLMFDDLNLKDVVLTISADKKTRPDGGTYYIASFGYAEAPALNVELIDFLKDTLIYREETLTEVSQIKLSYGMGFTIRPHGGFLSAPAAEESPETLPWETQNALPEPAKA